MTNILIDDEFKALIPALADDELTRLEASIVAEGCLQALVLWRGHDILVDGHNRYAICERHHLPYSVIYHDFDSREAVIVWMIEQQLGRRNLPEAVRILFTLRLKDALAAEARARQLGAGDRGGEGGRGNKKDETLPPNSAEGLGGETRDKLAAKAGVGKSKFTQAEAVLTKGPDYLRDLYLAGDISANLGYEVLKVYQGAAPAVQELATRTSETNLEKLGILTRLEKNNSETFAEIENSGYIQPGEEAEAVDWATCTAVDAQKALDKKSDYRRREAITVKRAERLAAPKPPEGIYNVVYADPPWQYDNTGVNGAADHHYPTMSLERICSFTTDIGLRVDKDAILFMWATNPFLEDAFKVLSAWGFSYKTNIVWVKTELRKPGSGFYVRGRHELLLLATKGNFTPLVHAAPPIGSVIESPIREHSQKPDEIYDLIETLYPGCRGMELFARTSREGWDAYGNQVDI